MAEKIGFPTLGDVAKELFDLLGFLANNRDTARILPEEKDKKTLRRKLLRLAEEKYGLEGNLEYVLNVLGQHLAKIIYHPLIAKAVARSFSDVLVQYTDLVKREGSFLSQKDTVEWAIRTRLLDRVVISYQKYMLAFRLRSAGVQTPKERFWWLPDPEGQTTIWPLTKAFNWIYEETNTSRTRFHNPDGENGDDSRHSNNFTNASRWMKAQSLPSVWELQRNLDESVAALEVAKDEKYRRYIHGEQAKNFYLVLLIARLSTVVFRRLEKVFGRELLVESVDYLRAQDINLADEHRELEKLIGSYMSEVKVPEKDIEATWESEVNRHWTEKGKAVEYNCRRVASLIERGAEKPDVFSDALSLEKYVGKFNARSIANHSNYSKAVAPSDGYIELLNSGFRLKNNSATIGDIQGLRSNVAETNFTAQLSWLVDWVEGDWYRKKGDLESAFSHYKNAFEAAQYVAGSYQYDLVNEFVEVCTQHNNSKDRKRGIAWARYLGIPLAY